MSLNDSQTRKFQAIVSRVDRGSQSKLDRLHLTDGKKWGQRSLGQAYVRWPHQFKSGDLVEVERKITKLDGGLVPAFPYNSLWNLLFMVLLLLGVSWLAGFMAFALFHIEGPGVHAQLFSITSGPPELSWVGLIVFIAVFIGFYLDSLGQPTMGSFFHRDSARMMRNVHTLLHIISHASYSRFSTSVPTGWLMTVSVYLSLLSL